jgi:hypothetical protein
MSSNRKEKGGGTEVKSLLLPYLGAFLPQWTVLGDRFWSII